MQTCHQQDISAIPVPDLLLFMTMYIYRCRACPSAWLLQFNLELTAVVAYFASWILFTYLLAAGAALSYKRSHFCAVGQGLDCLHNHLLACTQCGATLRKNPVHDFLTITCLLCLPLCSFSLFTSGSQ
jgi:hypothetical protein